MIEKEIHNIVCRLANVYDTKDQANREKYFQKELNNKYAYVSKLTKLDIKLFAPDEFKEDLMPLIGKYAVYTSYCDRGE